MKRSFVFSLAQDRCQLSFSDYPPPLIRPAYNLKPEPALTDRLARQKIGLLLAAYKRAGAEASQRWRQTNSPSFWQ